MDQVSLRQYAAAHHGVVSRAEAYGFGASPSQVKHRLSTGEWYRLAPGVFAISGTPSTWLQRARAQALSLDGVISHRAAAALHGIDGFEMGMIEVSIPQSMGRVRSDVHVHRSTQMRLASAGIVNGVPVTGIARTVLDVGAVVGWRRLEWMVDAVLRQRLLDWPDLYDVLIRHSVQGRNGCGPLRAHLDRRLGESAIPDSRWNRMVGQLLADSTLPEPQYEHVVRDEAGRFLGRVDLAYPRDRLAIELDSVRFHLNRESFEKDPRRRNRLLMSGWRVLTFTWSDYADNPRALVRTVAIALSN